MEFPKHFEDWLNSAATQLEPGVRTFAFNLYEPFGISGVAFGVDLIGANSYTPNDPDWACDAVWEPSPRGLDIPKSFSGLTWEVCLERIKVLVLEYLNTAQGSWLCTGAAVGVGFVDGDLHVVWRDLEDLG